MNLYERLLKKSEQSSSLKLSHDPETNLPRPLAAWARSAVCCPTCGELLEPGPTMFQCPSVSHGGLTGLGTIQARLRDVAIGQPRLRASSSRTDEACEEAWATFIFLTTHRSVAVK